jgi:hypothetical protein
MVIHQTILKPSLKAEKIDRDQFYQCAMFFTILYMEDDKQPSRQIFNRYLGAIISNRGRGPHHALHIYILCHEI